MVFDKQAIIDRRYMALALKLAANGLSTTDPNPCVGCVIVKNNTVLGEGWHITAGEAHAEVIALADAGSEAKGATAYVTLEPCCHKGRTGACTEALYAAGISRVVYAVDDPNPLVAGQGAEWLRAQGIDVTGGLLADQAVAINAGFWSRMQRQRPLVVSKLAVSIDGRTALSNGDSHWVSGESSREDVQRWRAQSSAVLTGVGTILADDPSLNVRSASYQHAKQPLRVILDSNLSTPPAARTLSLPGDVLIITVSDDASKRDALESAGASVVKVASDKGRVSLPDVLDLLAEKEINIVMLEAGSVLNGSFLQQGLINELLVYQASHLMGSDAIGMFTMFPLGDMSKRVELTLQDVCRIGKDLRLRYIFKEIESED